MKIFKRVVSVFLLLSLFVGSFAVSFALFNKGTYDFDPKYLSIFDEVSNTYYLQKTPSNIKFLVSITASDTALAYAVVDSAGNTVSLNSEKVSKNEYNILPPTDGYIAGERYTLTLGSGVSFADQSLKDARVLVFCIEREAVEEYKFTETVVETSTVIEKISSDRISVEGINAKPGEIVFGTNENDEYVAYKISEILDDKTATVTIPAIDEIYSDLQVYGEYEFDVNELTTNPDLEVEIIENVKKSNFYSALITTAYAADTYKDGDFEVSIKPDTRTNSLEVEIKITLLPGENGLFGINELKYHSVSVMLKSTIGLRVQANIQGISNWDVSGSVTSGFSWEVKIDRTVLEIEPGNGDDIGLQELFAEKDEYDSYDDYYIHKEYQKNIKKITDALNQISEDATGGELKIFDWKLPVPSVPGLYFSAEIKLYAKFTMTASLAISQENTTVYTVGVCFTNNKFRAYSNTYRSGEDVSLSLRGKADVKTGIKLIIKATVISDKIANINVDPQIGLYADVYATIPILGADEATIDRFLYSYFEPGVYFSANIKARLNILVKQFDFSYELVEKKFPIEAWTLGNKKIATGIVANATSVRAVNNIVKLPDILFEYYDVKNGVSAAEKISFEDLKFVSNEGIQLEEENGNLTLPAATSSGSCYITATYLHSDDKTYSTVFKVLISGSMLEGKVSAYTNDFSTGELEGAKVELYTATNNTTPVITQTTDESGKFSFNVSEGDYRLVISAAGYRTLTSYQQVKDNEIKYTEHILLMNNNQSGMGSAGGTVSNALTGRGISGVRLKLRNDWNNTSGPYVEGFETSTNSSGHYSVSNVPVGYYTVEASMNGYVTGYSNIIVLSENAKLDFDFTITPELAEDEIRIVLTWGASPSDLDSHLLGSTPSDGSFNVYYSDKHYHYEGVEMANLDVDDTSSYGPETITILEKIYGTYTYAVHNYSNKSSSNSTALSFSSAVVRVFIGSNQVAEYHVPTDQIGTYWTVFQIDDSGRIIPINTVSNTKPTAKGGIR